MKKTILIIFKSIITLSLYAQIPQDPISMLSPNASSLGEYGEVPVSLFTGIPQIEIPLYEIKSGNHTVPIYISYHGGGVRPDQRPGWTGMGWTLMAGGCISRVVNDRIDEYYNPNAAVDNPYNKIGVDMGYFYRCKTVADKDDWNTRANVSSLAINYGNYIDTAPDKFSFNFCGYSGEFYLSEKGEWKVKCDREIKVVFGNTNRDFTQCYAGNLFNTAGTTYYYNGASHSFGEFKLITEDGTQYIFGGSDSAIEFSIPFFRQRNERFIANTWNLTQINYTNGEKIYFLYEDDQRHFTAQMYYSLYYIYYIHSETTGREDFFIPDWSTLKAGYQGQLIIPSYLRKIIFPHGSVNFQKSRSNDLNYDFDRINEVQYEFYKKNDNIAGFLPILQNIGKRWYPDCLQNLSWFKLDEIRVCDKGGADVKIYTFEYPENNKRRLMLSSITEKFATYKGKKYKFEYNNPDSLPGYVTNQTDHWGFYNKRRAWTNDESVYPLLREPNESVCLYGTLDKIIYPTGGYTRFVFEQNDYLKHVSENRTSCISLSTPRKAGGIRIKEIINSPSGNAAEEKIVKKYFYVSDYLINKDSSAKSSGVLGVIPRYGFNDYTVSNMENTGKIRMASFSSQSVLPGTENSCGSHIGYSEVVEKYPDGSFSIYKFTNFDDGHLDQPCDVSLQVTTTVYEPCSSISQERGLLKEKTDYDKTGNIRNKRTIEYEKDNETNNYVRAIKTRSGGIVSSGLGMDYIDWFQEGTAYRIYTYLMRKKKETISIYETGTNKPNIRSIKYKYNKDKLISEIKRISLNGIYTSYYKYPCDYSTYDCDQMRECQLLNNLIEKRETVLKIGTLEETELEKLEFRYNNGIFVPSDCYISTNGSPLREKAHYEYDSRHNPIYIIEDGIKHTVYLWGYNYKYIVAEIKNATLDEVKSVIRNIENFSSEWYLPSHQINKLRQLIPKAKVTTFTYDLLVGIINKTDPNGNTTYYEYDDFGKLIGIKDTYGNILETYKYNFLSK